MFISKPGLHLFAIAVLSSIHAFATPAEVHHNTNQWFAVPHLENQSYMFDHAKDSQTGDPRAEFVGDTNNAGFYVAYDSDTSGTLNPQGRLLFRVRVAAFQEGNKVPTNTPGEYSSVLFIGIDGNSDGAIDLFVVADDRGGNAANNGVKLFFPSCPTGATNCFTGPPNTNLGNATGTNTTFSSVGLKQNFNWAQVSNTTDPRTGSEPPLNNNVIAGTEGANSSYRRIDGFFSFAVDFSSIGTALGSGQGPTQIANFTPGSSMRFIAITGQQTNTLNQDIGGCDNRSAVTSWACALSDPIIPNQLIAAPEPGTYATMSAALLGLAFYSRRRRKT